MLIALYVAVALCSAGNLALSGGLMAAHWQSGTQRLRRHTLYILAMVPLFGAMACCSAVWPRHFLYFDLVRESYEAWVLWQFYQLVLCYLEILGPRALNISEAVDHTNVWQDGAGEPYIMQTAEKLLIALPAQPLLWGRLWLTPSIRLLGWLRNGVLQYCVLRALLPPIMIALFELGLYANRQPDAQGGYVWLTLLCTASLGVVLLALLTLIKLTRPVIWPYAPTTKLLAIKLILFCVFWQSLALSGAAYMNAVPVDLFAPEWPLEQTTEVLQAALLSFELTCLALYHHWIFASDEHMLVVTAMRNGVY